MTDDGFEEIVECLAFLKRYSNGGRPHMHTELERVRELLKDFVANTPPADLEAPPLPALLSRRQVVEQAWAPPPFILPPLLHAGAFVFCTGDPESFKSFMTLGITLASSYGRLLWAPEDRIDPVACLYVSGESGPAVDQPRAGALIQGHDWPRVDGPWHLWDATAVDLTSAVGWDTLRAVQNVTQARVIVLDSLAALFPLQNENDNSLVTKFVKATILPLCRDLGLCLVVVAHPPKLPAGAAKGLRESQTIRGAMAWRAMADTILEFRRDPRTPGQFTIRVGKFRMAERPARPYRFEVRPANGGSTIACLGEDRPGQESRAASQRRILKALEVGPLALSALAESTGLAERTVQRHLPALERDGFIVPWGPPGGGRGKSALWALAPENGDSDEKGDN